MESLIEPMCELAESFTIADKSLMLVSLNRIFCWTPETAVTLLLNVSTDLSLWCCSKYFTYKT